jgi:mannose-1-phosphate guanylyltransferase/mannose-6-phosphate isomerase
MVPFNGQWSDVGNWSSVATITDPDSQGNRVIGQGLVHEASDTFVYAMHRPVVALGTTQLIIVDTPDALLVTSFQAAEQVRQVVAKLSQIDATKAETHRKVIRPWGWYDTIDSGPGFQVKRIGIKQGASLSLQYHLHRAEHWVIVSGTAEITRGAEVFTMGADESTYIPMGTKHRLRNIGSDELVIIEVQSGDYLGEDDIVRLEDAYGRLNPHREEPPNN